MLVKFLSSSLKAFNLDFCCFLISLTCLDKMLLLRYISKVAWEIKDGTKYE